jgi:hypothetical protein
MIADGGVEPAIARDEGAAPGGPWVTLVRGQRKRSEVHDG